MLGKIEDKRIRGRQNMRCLDRLELMTEQQQQSGFYKINIQK